jgi:hypothetical protein
LPLLPGLLYGITCTVIVCAAAFLVLVLLCWQGTTAV